MNLEEHYHLASRVAVKKSVTRLIPYLLLEAYIFIPLEVLRDFSLPSALIFHNNVFSYGLLLFLIIVGVLHDSCILENYVLDHEFFVCFILS